jgi:hypothetical protein
VLLLALPLLLGLAMVAVAGVVAAGFLLLPDPKVRTARGGALPAGRRTWPDPNEAARAAGSWG